NGDGTFLAAVSFAVGSSPRSVAVGDFNSDGRQDLAVANYSSNDVSVLLGRGDGTFEPALPFPVGTSPGSVAVSDFNGDGLQDLAVASGGVSVLLGNGHGDFRAAVNVPAGIGLAVAVGDFNRDGAQDLVGYRNTGYRGGPLSVVSVVLGNGDGTFRTAPTFAAGTGPSSVVVGDFDGDNKLDLAVTNNADPGSVSVLLGNGDGTFGEARNFDAGTYPRSVAVGD